MSKYIKLEDAISKIVNTPTRVITDDLSALADRQHEIIDMLADLPTIEIVRCSECKYREKCEQIVAFEIGENQIEGRKIDFCSYGERIDNE